MTKQEIELLLKQNGYTIHPLFGFLYQAKLNLGSYFYITDINITVGKIKYGNINIKETRQISIKSFDPHTYSLVTDLDRKRIALTTQRMAINRAKQKNLIDKGYKETPKEEPDIES